MAVEAHHLHFFPPQMINNREVIKALESNINLYGNHMGFGIQGAESLLPFYNSAVADPVQATADSGLTCNLSAPRKRLREYSNPSPPISNTEKDRSPVHPFPFLGQDISFQIQQQQYEMDRFIAQHMEKVQREMSEKRRRHTRQLIATIEEGVMKRLKAKEEQIEKIGKLNWMLEEKVKSLCMENQIWRDLAQSNEATANALRSNLEQILAQVRCEQSKLEVEEDAESCCGSSSGEGGEEGDEDEVKNTVKDRKDSGNGYCRSCGKEESSVLLMPCRHLCVCSCCSSAIQTCPICKCNKNGTVHVNLS